MEKQSSQQQRDNIIEEVNKVRTDPKAYSEKLKSYVSYFKGNILRVPDKTPIKTNEGPAAFEEAAKFLEGQAPLGALRVSLGLNLASQESLSEIQKTEDTAALDNQNLDAIIDKFGDIEGHFAQAVDFGSSTAELVVINLIVDDGDTSRGNRNNILSPQFRFIGVASGDHSSYNDATVLMFARTFIDKAGLTESSDANTNSNTKTDTKAENKAEASENIATTKQTDEKKEESSAQQEKGGNKVLDKVNALNKAASTIQNKVDEIEKGVSKTSIKAENKAADDDFDLPEGVAKIERQEKLVTENGVQKKIVKVTRHMEDGSTETDVFKELVNR